MLPRRLRRSADSRILVGVAGGVGEYFSVDPVLARVGFVVATIAGGVGVLVYLALALMMAPPAEGSRPRASDKPPGSPGSPDIDGSPTSEEANRRRSFLGLVLVAVGAFLLLVNLGAFRWLDWGAFWALAIIATGGVLVAQRFRRS
jgi:phage shock protein PspC (stress-responsive transcriptional regulator)